MTSVTCIMLDLERFYRGHALYIKFCDDARQVHFPYGKCTWRVSSMDTFLTIPLPSSVIRLIGVLFPPPHNPVGLRWTPPDSTGLHWTEPPAKLDIAPAKHGGLQSSGLQWTPV